MMADKASPPAAPDVRSPSTFVRELHKLNRQADEGRSDARGALARLRRSLGVRELDLAALRDVGAWLPERVRDDELDAYLLTAALFALFQPPVIPKSTAEEPRTSSWRSSLGITLRGLRRDLSVGAESLDRRVTALLDADSPELPYYLRQLVQMLKGTPHVPDWLQLLQDLRNWTSAERKVQRRWARDYWTGSVN